MPARTPEAYRDLAERSWRWVMDQVRWDDGPWIPGSVTLPEVTEPPWDRDGMHSGVGGLAHVLAEQLGVVPIEAQRERFLHVAERVGALVQAPADERLGIGAEGQFSRPDRRHYPAGLHQLWRRNTASP